MTPLSLSGKVPAIDVYLGWTPGSAVGVVIRSAGVVGRTQVAEGEPAHLRKVRATFRPDSEATLLSEDQPDC